MPQMFQFDMSLKTPAALVWNELCIMHHVLHAHSPGHRVHIHSTRTWWQSMSCSQRQTVKNGVRIRTSHPRVDCSLCCSDVGQTGRNREEEKEEALQVVNGPPPDSCVCRAHADKFSKWPYSLPPLFQKFALMSVVLQKQETPPTVCDSAHCA